MAKNIVLISIFLIDSKLIWVPIQKRAAIKNNLLKLSKVVMVCWFKFNCVPNSTAKINTNTNRGNLAFSLSSFLNKSPSIIIKGIIHKVLPSFNVVAISAAFPPYDKAAPITELVSWIAIAIHAPNLSSDISMLFPITGNNASAIKLNIKIIAKEVSKSFCLAFINGEIAAIAVTPQIAVPEANNKDSLVSILRILPIINPNKNVKITKTEIYGKYVAVKSITLDADIVRPIITMAVWSNMVPVDFLINSLDDPKTSVKLAPKIIAINGELERIAIKAKKIPANSFILLYVVLVRLGRHGYETWLLQLKYSP